MQATINENVFTPELLKSTGDFAKFCQLEVIEPGINWLAWCAKLYKRTHSVKSVSLRLNGVWRFSEFLATQAQASESLIFSKFTEVRQAQDADKYRVFDDFSTWCDSVKGYNPNTTWASVQSAKALADYENCKLNDDDFGKHVTMPQATQLNEEYPPNDDLIALENASSPRHRTFLRYLADTGAEPIDAAKLHKSMIYFGETPVRIEYKRKKTGKPITQFVSDETAQALKAQIERTNSADGYVFIRKLGGRVLGGFYNTHSDVCERAGLTAKVDGTKFSKYHFKIYKKRWFTMAVAAGIPDYVAHGMLGRKKYLDQYMALPVDQKREFAKKILRKVALRSTEATDAEKAKIAAETLGLPAMSAEQFSKLRAVLLRALDMPESPILADTP